MKYKLHIHQLLSTYVHETGHLSTMGWDWEPLNERTLHSSKWSNFVETARGNIPNFVVDEAHKVDGSKLGPCISKVVIIFLSSQSLS